MAALSIQVPYPVFYDRDGQPLDNGNIYIGVANLDPVTNPLQVYYDEALTIQASQPLKTSGGYVYRNGTPTQLYVNAIDFSITVNDSKDTLVYSFPEGTGLGVGAGSIAFTGFKGQNGFVSDLADNDGSDWIGFLPDGIGAVARSAQEKMRDMISVKDFGAVGNGVVDDTAAFQAAVDEAVASSGVVYVPAGKYLIDDPIQIPFVGGIKIVGSSVNSLGSRSVLLQKNIEKHVFEVNGINVSMSGLSFTVWAGNIVDANNGNPITVVSATANSITLSADPWPGQAPVIWAPTSPQIATDGTPYPNCIQVSVAGSFYASGATKNGNGTVTLTGVKGANGTVNGQVPLTVGSTVSAFVSLAHTVVPVDPEAGIIYLGVKENHFYDHLWFNQVTSAFVLSQFGSGSGPGVGVGNVGFLSEIVIDQARYFVKAMGDASTISCSNCEIFGIQQVAFYAPFGGISSSSFTGNQLIVGKFMQLNNDLDSTVIVGNNFNARDGDGYSDLLFNIAGSIRYSTISGNNFGRASSICVQFVDMEASIFSGNNIISNGEATANYWMQVTNDITNSTLENNNFAQLYTSTSNKLLFLNPAATIVGSTFGGEWIGGVGGISKIGWINVNVFQNGWSNVGGGVTPPTRYFKDQNGIVTVEGAIIGGASGTVAFTLPAGFRPLQQFNRFMAGVRWDGAARQPFYAEIDNTTGDVTFYGAVTSWGQFNISFPTKV